MVTGTACKKNFHKKKAANMAKHGGKCSKGQKIKPKSRRAFVKEQKETVRQSVFINHFLKVNLTKQNKKYFFESLTKNCKQKISNRMSCVLCFL